MNTSRSFYRVLLRMCPPDLRAEFGAEMEALFLADLDRARGLGKMRVWARDRRRVRHGSARATMRGIGSAAVGLRRVRHGRILDGYLAIRPAARDSRMCAPARHQRDHRVDAGARHRRQHRGVLRGPHRVDPAAAVSSSPSRS